ncbi:hypothetical protein N5P37_005689 [Trichoderma harzianum]|nr:hypothetical protein N5P37_005689 [Trichoderma harzianum]
MKARWSRFWLIWIDMSGRRSETIHELHQKYGSVVRIGPREVSFSSRQAMKDLYGSGNKFMKGPTEHRSRQKRIAHVFAPASIAAVEPLVKEQVQKLLHSFGGLDNEAPPKILYDLDEVFPSLLIEWQFAAIRSLLLAIPHKPMQHFLRIASEFYDKYGTEKFNEYIARHGRSGDRIDLLTKLIAGSKDYGPLDDNEIVNETTNLFFAGTDTTSNTFTYMFYELAKHPQWQKQLQAELDEAVLEEVPEYKHVMNLRVLDAVIHETLRFHPAAPASLQRLAPSEGGAVVDGIAIPQNFDPGRWLSASEDHLNVMHEYILVWGKGQRACLGKPMAYMELKVGTAALIGKFSVEIGSVTIDDDMEMTDHFALVPKGKRCILRLKERS